MPHDILRIVTLRRGLSWADWYCYWSAGERPAPPNCAVLLPCLLGCFTRTPSLPQLVCKHSWANKAGSKAHLWYRACTSHQRTGGMGHQRVAWLYLSVLLGAMSLSAAPSAGYGVIWPCVNSQNAIFIGNTMPHCCDSLNIETTTGI